MTNIVNTHLGKGSVSYSLTDTVSKNLLVREERSKNREIYGIDSNNLPFVGYDVWHAYEFCSLELGGMPAPRILKVVYPSNSKYIVESKSLKLYLNSWNFTSPVTPPSVEISKDLSELLECEVHATLHYLENEPRTNPFVSFKRIIPLGRDSYHNLNNEFPEALEVPEKPGAYTLLKWHLPYLRSNCKITNQPDWGDVYVHLSGKKTPSSDNLIKYIVSFRKENHFHEECCEMIYKRLWDRYEPEELFVACLYTRRGGIDINPIRASNPTLLRMLASNIISSNELTSKTARQ